VVQARSFTVAATELGYTQSAISQQVAALEQELGRPLLHRRPVRPTPAGERLAEHAVRILLRVDVARTDVEQIHRESVELAVAAGPGPGQHRRAGRAPWIDAPDLTSVAGWPPGTAPTPAVRLEGGDLATDLDAGD
jgi:DNA-binding transcriptional LysR family regulator